MSVSETGVSARVVNDILESLPEQVRAAYRSAHNKSWLAIHDKRGIAVAYTAEEIEACMAFEQALGEKKIHKRAIRPQRLHLPVR